MHLVLYYTDVTYVHLGWWLPRFRPLNSPSSPSLADTSVWYQARTLAEKMSIQSSCQTSRLHSVMSASNSSTLSSVNDSPIYPTHKKQRTFLFRKWENLSLLCFICFRQIEMIHLQWLCLWRTLNCVAYDFFAMLFFILETQFSAALLPY